MPAAKGRRKRIDCKILRLPPEIKWRVEDIIINQEMTFQGISDWLGGQGYEISKSAVGSYAYGMNRMAQSVADELAKTEAILDYIGRNPDIDAAKAAQALMTSGLMQRISTAEDDFLEMPLDKAGRLIASFRRVNVAEKKLTFEMRTKLELAFDEMESQLLEAIHHDPTLSAQFKEVLLKAKEKVTSDE